MNLCHETYSHLTRFFFQMCFMAAKCPFLPVQNQGFYSNTGLLSKNPLSSMLLLVGRYLLLCNFYQFNTITVNLLGMGYK